MQLIISQTFYRADLERVIHLNFVLVASLQRFPLSWELKKIISVIFFAK